MINSSALVWVVNAAAPERVHPTYTIYEHDKYDFAMLMIFVGSTYAAVAVLVAVAVAVVCGMMALIFKFAALWCECEPSKSKPKPKVVATMVAPVPRSQRLLNEVRDDDHGDCRGTDEEPGSDYG